MRKIYLFKSIVLLIVTCCLLGSCAATKSKSNVTFENQEPKNHSWALTSFVKVDSVNPILAAIPESKFLCPVRNSIVDWEGKDVFNPAVVVKDNKVYMLYRAEDFIGKWKGTSRLGLAISDDGLNFSRLPEPVFYPENDEMSVYEWEGGCEDPRIIEDNKGLYYLTYTAWDGITARLFIATSTDLLKWKKHGYVFEKALDGKYVKSWTKAGSIVCKVVGDKMIATKINEKYWMYFGESNIFLAHSDDLINWTPIERETGSISEELIGHSIDVPDLQPVVKTRIGKFDSHLIEPGPPAIITENGILLIYNSKNSGDFGDPSLAPKTYAGGQALFDKNDPSKLINRLDSNFFQPDKPYEIEGQINHVCFLEGLVYFKEKWFLYYGTADSKIAVAVKE